MIETVKKILKKLIVNPGKYHTTVDTLKMNFGGYRYLIEFIVDNYKHILYIWDTAICYSLKDATSTNPVGVKESFDVFEDDRYEILGLAQKLNSSCKDYTRTILKAFAND